jgi:long-chain fatty acid transport protein
MNYRKTLLTALLAPILAFGSGTESTVHASGYAVFTQGAAALGQGNAVTAHSESPSSIFYNPALINKLDGTQMEFGTTLLAPSHQFESDQVGGRSTSNDSVFFPSTFYATHKFNDSLSAGLGVFNPFGLATKWSGDWDGRYQATKSQLTTFDINPVVSYRILPGLSVAAGLDVILLDATLEKKIPAGAFGAAGPASETGVKFKGDGTGYGYNLAVAYDLTREMTIGVSYRSKIDVDVDGNSSTSPTFAVPLPPLFTTFVTPLNSKGRTSLTLPQQLTAGLAYQVSAPLILEVGLRWEGWSAFKSLKLTLDNGTAIPETPRNWHDTFGLNAGGKYRLNDNVALMWGYVYGNNAVPDSTFDPSIPDANTHVFCVGTDLSYQQFKLALAYAYQVFEDRKKNNNIGEIPGIPTATANGEYKSDAHLLAVSLGYKF